MTTQLGSQALGRGVSWLGRQLFPFARPMTAGELLFFRVFESFVCAWAIQFAWTWAPVIDHLKAVILPLGLANYLPVEGLFDHGLGYVVAGALTITLALGWARRASWAYAVAVLLFHILYVSRYSLGEISHGSHFPGMAVLALALATLLFNGSPQSLARFAYGLVVFLFGIGYTSAGVCKLVASGITWPSGAHMALWVGERSIDVTSTFGSFELNQLQELMLQHPLLGTIALTFGLLAELAGVLLFVPAARPYVATALITMHLGVEVTLNIFFGHNIYLLLLVGYPWGRALDWLAQRARGAARRPCANP